MKAYWIAIYKDLNNVEDLKRYAEKATPAIKKFNGKILVRGGKTKTVEGIPGLMDIPFIGKLFSSESTTSKKTELMIFITPHIISTVEDSSHATREMQKRLSSLKSNYPQS